MSVIEDARIQQATNSGARQRVQAMERQEQAANDQSEIPPSAGESGSSPSEREAGRDVPDRAADLASIADTLDAVGVLAVILDQQGRVQSFNQACERTTGYSLNEVRDRHIWDVLVVPEEVEPVKGVFDKLRSGLSPVQYEGHWLTRDGRRRLITWSYTTLSAAGGFPEYVVATGMDVTERRRAEEVLRSSEERYRRLVDSSPDAIMVHYRGKIVFINNAGATLLGASRPEQVIGKPVMDFVHPEHRPIVKERLQKIIEQGTELPLVEDKLVRLDGQVIHIDVNSIFPLMYDDKPAVQVVAREVTGQGRLPEALREAEDRYRLLLHVSAAGIYRASPDGSLLECNERFAETLGYESVEEVLALRPSELYLDPADWQEFVSQMRETGHVDDFELRLRHKDGNPVWVLQSAALIEGRDGAPSVVQATAIDISRRKAAEESLSYAEQMYRTLANISSDAVTATDLRGRITEVSQRTLELHGIESTEELVGRSFFELIAPEDHEKAIGDLQRALKEGSISNVEYTLLRQDGSRFIAVSSTTLIRDELGKPKAFVITARELTEAETHPPSEELRRAAAHEAAVAEACRMLSQYPDFPRAARALFDACKKSTGATNGYVVLSGHDTAPGKILFSDSVEIGDAFDPSLSSPIRRLRSEALDSGRPTYSNDLPKTEWAQPVAREKPPFENLLLVPVILKGSLEGFLALGNKPGGFSDTDVGLASVFGDLAAVALQNRRTVEALQVSEDRFRSVADTVDHAVVTFDSREYILFWNRGAETIFGYSADEIVGKRLTLVAPDGLRGAYQKVMNRVAKTGRLTIVAEGVQMAGRRKDGSEFPLELSLAMWRSRGGLLFTCMIRDMTERKLAEETMRQLADHDPVTGLANRLLLTDRLTLALANADRDQQKLAVLMLDLDGFSNVNHTLGHGVGDQLLKAVGGRLSSLLRGGDTVARVGGDEFMLLLPGIREEEHVDKIAQKVLRALREPFLLSGHELQITTSIGIAIYPDDGEDVETLTKNADLTLHRAKDKGRDNYQRFSASTKSRGTTGLVLVT
jgi:diguanylate cyclase (GGDEF)-like protein/PAS domain S-box-containing protein